MVYKSVVLLPELRSIGLVVCFDLTAANDTVIVPPCSDAHIYMKIVV